MISAEEPAPVAKWWWSHTTCILQGLPQLHMTTSNWKNKLPLQGIPNAPNVTRLGTGDWNAMEVSHLHQGMHLCQRMQPPTGSQCGKSRYPPGSHSCHHGRGGKTDAIDVGEDQSHQDEIVLYAIQADATTVATTHTKVNTEEAPIYYELFINVVNCGTIEDTHPEADCGRWCPVPHSAMKHGYNSTTACKCQQ